MPDRYEYNDTRKSSRLTGPEGLRVCERVIRCEVPGDAFLGGVNGLRLLLPFGDRTRPLSVSTSIGGPSGGVGFSELL